MSLTNNHCRSDRFAMTLHNVLCEIQDLCVEVNAKRSLETIKETVTNNNNIGKSCVTILLRSFDTQWTHQFDQWHYLTLSIGAMAQWHSHPLVTSVMDT